MKAIFKVTLLVIAFAVFLYLLTYLLDNYEGVLTMIGCTLICVVLFSIVVIGMYVEIKNRENQ